MRFLGPSLVLALCSSCATPPLATDSEAQRTVYRFDPVRHFYPGELPSLPEAGEVNGLWTVVSPVGAASDGVYFFRNGFSTVISPTAASLEGVYFCRDGFSTLILQLKDGRYSYRVRNETGHPEEDLIRYPVMGRYSAQGPIVKLECDAPCRLQPEWAFRNVDGKPTLWRPTAVRAWHDRRAWDSNGILYKTDLAPEEIGAKNVLKTGL